MSSALKSVRSRLKSSPLPSLRDPVQRQLAKVSILILSSSRAVNELCGNMLRQYGFSSIYTAQSGADGVSILKERDVHMIIAGPELQVSVSEQTHYKKAHNAVHELPLVCGDEFIRRLRHSPNSPAPYVPVIMLAPDQDALSQTKVRDAGVNEICDSPMNAQAFAACLHAVSQTAYVFITAGNYRGPCRRRGDTTAQDVKDERRQYTPQVLKFQRPE